MMKDIVTAACLLALLSACSTPPDRSAHPGLNRTPSDATTSDTFRTSIPGPVQTWFDPQTSQRIIEARADFDAAELAALGNAERSMGAYRHVMSIPREQYVRQLAGERSPVTRSDAWQREYERRAAYVTSVLGPEIEAARARLERETLTALSEFFRRELRAGRITRTDYDRYTAEIRRGYFPGFRGRKWSGPAVYEFRGADVSPEYQKVLQEVRRLWQAQGRRASEIISIQTGQEFYARLAPRAP